MSLAFLDGCTASGVELVNLIAESCKLSIYETEFDNWPRAVQKLMTEWCGPESMSKMSYGIVVRVKRGTCYVGASMLLFNPGGSLGRFHAILLDPGFGFDTTAAAVSQAGYVADYGQPYTDLVDQITNWRVISKEHQGDPDDALHSRFGRLLTALANPAYQEPVGTVLRPVEDRVTLNGARYQAQDEQVMCRTVIDAQGGHGGCVLIAGHHGDHKVRVGPRHGTPQFQMVARNIKGLCCASPSAPIAPAPALDLSALAPQRAGSECEKNEAASTILSLAISKGETVMERIETMSEGEICGLRDLMDKKLINLAIVKGIKAGMAGELTKVQGLRDELANEKEQMISSMKRQRAELVKREQAVGEREAKVGERETKLAKHLDAMRAI